MNFEVIFSILNQYKYYFIIGFAILFLVIIFATRSSLKRSLRKQFEGVEIQYNELMSIPILFKINKALGLAKLNPKVDEKVKECKVSFDDLSKSQERIVSLLADTEDALAYGKLKESKNLIEELDELVAYTLEQTTILDSKLETLLEQETQQRYEITQQKERFRKLKLTAQERSSVLGSSMDALDEQVKEIEHLFSAFEEWMYASDFTKAHEVSEDISEQIQLFEDRVNGIPKLYEFAKGLIPQLLEEVSKLFQGVRSKGVYVDHLEVPKNIGVLSEILRDDLIGIGQGEIIKTKESLLNSQKRLEQIAGQIQKEDKAFNEVNDQSVLVFDAIDYLMNEIIKLHEKSSVYEKRFNFEGLEASMAEYRQQIDGYQELRLKIERMIEEEQIPASTILISVNELGQDVTILKNQFETMKQTIDQANSDEVRAEKQLLKLYLIINDVQVRIKKRSLPYISEKFEEDVKTALTYTRNVSSLLKAEMVNVKELNHSVDEAIDYIYKLHNNVNNLVGVVDMCENAIVYANKFRAYVPDIDSELTRAELAFNNGEYTQALSTIINSIDRYKPNTAYEEMIRDNAKSAR